VISWYLYEESLQRRDVEPGAWSMCSKDQGMGHEAFY
jgi:hypothetical protein